MNLPSSLKKTITLVYNLDMAFGTKDLMDKKLIILQAVMAPVVLSWFQIMAHSLVS